MESKIKAFLTRIFAVFAIWVLGAIWYTNMQTEQPVKTNITWNTTKNLY